MLFKIEFACKTTSWPIYSGGNLLVPQWALQRNFNVYLYHFVRLERTEAPPVVWPRTQPLSSLQKKCIQLYLSTGYNPVSARVMKRNINIKAYDIVTLSFIALINSQSKTLWPLRGKIVSLQHLAVLNTFSCSNVNVDFCLAFCLFVHDFTINESRMLNPQIL